MKFSILGFDQSGVLSLSKNVVDKNGKEKTIQLDVTDLLILQEISDFMNRKRIIKYNIDDKTFFSVQYSVILEDLPILNIKKQALSDRIDKMVTLGVIEKYIAKNQAGSFSAFRLAEKYEDLVYRPTSSELRVQKCSTTSAKVVDYTPKDNTTNTNTTNTKKEDTKKETAQDIVAFWNNKTSEFPKVRKTTDDINNSIKKLLARKYTYEDIKKAILLCNSLDDFYKGRKKNSNWKATLQWLLANTNKNFDKILNGALHTSDTQQKIYDNIMSNDTSDMGSSYNPKMDGFNMIWLEGEKCYMTPFEFSMLNDGYTKDDRPSSAVVMHNGIKYQWDVELKDWRKL